MGTKPMREVPELPTLDSGIHLLETDSRNSGALQSLVLDHLLTQSDRTNAVWIDSHGNGSTQPFARLAPSMRVLNRGTANYRPVPNTG